MKTLLAILLATLCAATSYGQTMKALSYNASNGVVAYSGTNDLRLPSSVRFGGDTRIISSILQFGDQDRISLEETRFVGDWTFAGSITFEAAASVRTNLGAQATLISGTNIKTINGQPILGAGDLVISGGTNTNSFNQSLNTTDDVTFNALNVSNKALTRTNLSLGAAWLTNGNVTNFRTAIGLGETNDVTFNKVTVGSAAVTLGQTSGGGIAIGGQGSPDIVVIQAGGMSLNLSNYGYGFGTNNPQGAGITRTNFGLGSTNIVTFAGLTNNGDITINSTTASNGLLYIRRTNNEAFLGLANLIASNNTTISNETLFRVGVAEATNRSAQFGFRSTNTNGSGVAVFSVFGYNALAMVGPSARSATNTNGIEADIYSINPTNKVATLIDTNTGATLMHRPVGFTTNASTPSSTNTIVGWIQFFVGTNSVRVPYYQ